MISQTVYIVLDLKLSH